MNDERNYKRTKHFFKHFYLNHNNHNESLKYHNESDIFRIYLELQQQFRIWKIRNTQKK